MTSLNSGLGLLILVGSVIDPHQSLTIDRLRADQGWKNPCFNHKYVGYFTSVAQPEFSFGWGTTPLVFLPSPLPSHPTFSGNLTVSQAGTENIFHSTTLSCIRWAEHLQRGDN